MGEHQAEVHVEACLEVGQVGQCPGSCFDCRAELAQIWTVAEAAGRNSHSQGLVDIPEEATDPRDEVRATLTASAHKPSWSQKI